jgi:hypothetical protein
MKRRFVIGITLAVMAATAVGEDKIEPGTDPAVEQPILNAWKKARIDFTTYGKSKITVSGNWGDGSDIYVWGESTTPLSDEWEEMTVAVVPEDDCNLMFMLTGPHRPIQKGSEDLFPIWVEYDDLKIEGATLLNPSFETLDDNQLPVGWKCVLDNVVIDTSAAEGQKCVRAWFKKPVVQKLAAKAGQTVTITAKVRRAQTK